MARATILSLPVMPKLSNRGLPSDPIIGISLHDFATGGFLLLLDTARHDGIIARIESGSMGG